MSNLTNSVRLMGFLGTEPEVKDLSKTKKVLNLTMATHESYKNDNGEKVEETQWHQLVFWDKQADIASKFLKKGSELVIEGKLVNQSYTDKEGIKRYSTKIFVNSFEMLGKKA